MINPFQKLGDLKKMRDQAVEIQKQLSSEVVTLEKRGIYLVISGDQNIRELKIDGREDQRLLETINEAIKKSQEIAARKLQSMGGGLSGLLGQ